MSKNGIQNIEAKIVEFKAVNVQRKFQMDQNA